MRSDAASRRHLVEVILLLVSVVAVVAMHGVSAHASAVPTAVLGPADRQSHHDTDASHHHDQHERDRSCEGCDHGAASVCALIVAGALGAPPRSGQSQRFRSTSPTAPSIRALSPDPPVPKVAVAR